DPLMYRIRHAHHYRRGDTWCIYPMYDWAHGQSDALEGITHSLCTLEFDNNRELYDWFLDNLGFEKRPHQYEFARGNVDYTVMSKRKLLQLVNEGHVMGWDDPRMPTIAGMRRRGVTPEAIRAFWERVGVAKVNSRVDISLLEYSIRDDLNHRAPRVMAVLKPLKVTITNYPEDQEEWLEASYWPHDVPKEGSRNIPFSGTLFIERDDFMEEPSKKFYRLAPGREVRLRYGYFITCNEVIKDDAGEIVELLCTYDPATKGGNAPDGRRVKGTLHWVSAEHALPAEIRLFDRLFTVPDPDGGEEDFKTYLNPESLVTLTNCYVEPSVADDAFDTRYQFERQGYFWRDPEDATEEHLVFNRIVALRDSWAKRKQTAPAGQPKSKKKAKAPAVPKAPQPERDPREDLTLAQEARLLRYTKDHNLQLDDALILVDNLDVADFYEDALKAHYHPQAVANWVIHELLRELKDTPLNDLPFDGTMLGRLVELIDDDTLSSRLAKDVFDEMLTSSDDPQTIIERKGIEQVSDTSTLEPIIDKLLAEFPDKVEAYRGGKNGLLGFFTGQVMQAT
ncbi:MAG: glutamine--tRNA ligase/YqeY domain fusion protein, partial [Acidiferrobacterales bacterium]|nr:glutamine--tRNA ligase/YqeY domain fusion protein [Acidiferrobacterales bacterium]